jgi:hypothetical protein
MGAALSPERFREIPRRAAEGGPRMSDRTVSALPDYSVIVLGSSGKTSLTDGENLTAQAFNANILA